MDQQNLLERVLNAWRLPDLRRKLLYTFGILVLFRLIAHVPIPGVDAKALASLLQGNQMLSMLDLFSGGAMSSFSVAAMGVYPYITATIVMQLMVPIIPRLEALTKEGEAGRNKITQYQRLMTVPLAFLQSFGNVTLLSNQAGGQVIRGFGLNHSSTFLSSLTMLLTLTAGTMLLVWLGELITENGIGNGVSLIIFAGIVARLPTLVSQTAQQQVAGNSIVGPVVLAVVVLLIVVGIVLIYQGERRIRVQYARRIRGSKITQGGGSTFIPLKVNSAGMIPLIFAASIMLFPGNVASYFKASANVIVRNVAGAITDLFSTQGFVYWILYFFLVVGFAYFYTFVQFQQQNPAETLQRHGGFIPGIRPGRPTAEYLNRVLSRITMLGALFLACVAVAPFFIRSVAQAQALTLSSTALLIVVGVVLDTMKQLEAQLLMRRYQGFIK